MIEAIKFMVKRWYYGRRFEQSTWTVIPRRNRLLMYMFLTQWLHWVENGAGKHTVFTRDNGLCVSWSAWRTRYYPNRVLLADYMYDMLNAEFSSPAFPFGGAVRYHYEVAYKSMHQNPLRIKWAKKMAKIFWDGVSFMDEEGRS